MKFMAKAFFMFLLFFPATVFAGPIYGTIRVGPNPLRSAEIEVACPNFNVRRPIRATARTDKSGSFRINVRSRGRCMLRVNRIAPIVIYSSNNPIRYDFEVVNKTLRRR